MKPQDSLVEFWDKNHKEDSIRYLTGTDFDTMCKYFCINNIIKPYINVLEIGVGRVYGVKGYKNKGCNIYALDISQEALNKVSPYILQGFLHKDITSIPNNFFDLVTSHLVAQHMSDSDLRLQFVNIIRALKPNGIFCIQMAQNMNKDLNNLPDFNLERQQYGNMGRTKNYMIDLVKTCRGQVIEIGGDIDYTKTEYQLYWYWLKIQKEIK